MYAKNTPTRSVPSSSPRAMTLCGIELVLSFRGRREARRDWKEGEAGAYANLGKKDMRAANRQLLPCHPKPHIKRIFRNYGAGKKRAASQPWYWYRKR